MPHWRVWYDDGSVHDGASADAWQALPCHGVLIVRELGRAGNDLVHMGLDCLLLICFRTIAAENPHWILSLTNPSPTSTYHSISRRIKGLFSPVLPGCVWYVLLVWAQFGHI